MRNLLYSLMFLVGTSIVAMGQFKEDFAFHNQYTDPIKSVQVYPNPAIEFVNVKFEAPIANKVRISVHNVIGNMMELETETISEYEIRIKVKDLSMGYYLISIKDGLANTGNTLKFLKR